MVQSDPKVGVDRSKAIQSDPSSAIRVKYFPLFDLANMTDVRNAKEHDVGAIIASIERFGFVGALILNEATGKLLAGHGRIKALSAMKANGYDRPARIRELRSDWTVPVFVGASFESEDEALAYLIADNRTVELGGWNDEALLAALKHLDESSSIDGTGYDHDDMNRMLGFLEGTAVDPLPPSADKDSPDEFNEYDEDLPTEHRCPSCGYTWSGKTS